MCANIVAALLVRGPRGGAHTTIGPKTRNGSLLQIRVGIRYGMNYGARLTLPIM